jgi:transposase
MMGRKDGQLEIVITNFESLIETLVPESHLLRRIDKNIDFGFIYEKAAPYYSRIGRKSVDPVCLMKMLLIGYLYGIKSERRLVEDVSLNLAFRWFCGFELHDKIPDHSIFSQNRRRRFTDSSIFSGIFNHIVCELIGKGLVSGSNAVSDGSFVPANVASYTYTEIVSEVEQSTVHYMDALDAELRAQPGYKEPTPTVEEKVIIKSSTDTDCGYINHEHKKGLGYLTEMTVDADNGIVLGVDCYPANQRESNIILKHIGRITTETGVCINKLGLDAGYDVGAVHRGLEMLGITGYVSPIQFNNTVIQQNTEYVPETDCFKCLAGKVLSFKKLVYKKSTQNYFRLYQMSTTDRKSCKNCEHRKLCSFSYGAARLNVSSYYPAFYQNRRRCETSEYRSMKRLRSIWAEGTFSVLKREHNLSKARKRGLERVHEECLLSALALNLKRMVKALERLDDAAIDAVISHFSKSFVALCGRFHTRFYASFVV